MSESRAWPSATTASTDAVFTITHEQGRSTATAQKQEPKRRSGPKACACTDESPIGVSMGNERRGDGEHHTAFDGVAALAHGCVSADASNAVATVCAPCKSAAQSADLAILIRGMGQLVRNDPPCHVRVFLFVRRRPGKQPCQRVAVPPLTMDRCIIVHQIRA